MAKVFQWTLKDKSINFYKEKELLTYVRGIIPKESTFEVRDRREHLVSICSTLSDAKKVIREMAGEEIVWDQVDNSFLSVIIDTEIKTKEKNVQIQKR